MKRRIVGIVVVAAVLLVGLVMFFKPLLLSDIIRDGHQIEIATNELGVQDGEPFMNSAVYQTISAEQENAIRTLLGQYNYHRTWDTPFSDSAVSDLGSRTLTIYVYDEASLVESIFVTASDQIVVRDKRYRMENAGQLIERITAVLERANET